MIPKGLTCPHCQNDDPKMLELVGLSKWMGTPNRLYLYVCTSCAKEFTGPPVNEPPAGV